MVNSSRVSILPVWKKLENKKENDLPNLSCTIKCGNIALWKGAGARSHEFLCISNDVRTAGFYFKLGDLARIFPLIAHLLVTTTSFMRSGFMLNENSTKGSFQNGLENFQFIWCIVFSFPSYILKMLTFKHFIASSFKALSLF